ncbi:DM13 domain-containing protein [Ruania zhangjianzhongii]|uniref:DM13 domain-containing protein n=1 Tax=Ruania zhangjianzhongii TaxID=2603206 RepID=UPI0011CA6A5E|nr:DM13 domain-containing protein [Ruania zhangjianzhongii]
MRKSALTGAAFLALTLTLAACSGTSDDSMTDEPMTDEPTSSESMSEDMAGEETSDEDMSGEDMDGEDMSGEGMDGEDMSDEDMTAMSGMFESQDGMVTGSVEISETEIVLSDFSSGEAPDLRLYLTQGTDEAAVSEGVEIDAVAFDEESQTFDLDGVDVTAYDTVLIYSDEEGAVFGAAALS